MLIDNIRIYEYNLPLQEISMMGQLYDFRKGIIIEFNANGLIGLGEAAPLDHFSKESLIDVISQVMEIKSLFLNRNFDDFQTIVNFIDSLDIPPSLQFAFESALLELFFKANDSIDFPQSGFKADEKCLKSGLLLDINNKEQLSEINTQHYSKIKLKISGDVEEDILLFNKAIDLLPSNSMIRVDANRKWSTESAINFLSNINLQRLDFIEEPSNNISDYHMIYKLTNANIAFDETIYLNEKIPEDIEWIKAFVIKPTLTGSFNKIVSLYRFAQENDITTIFSSTFESALGIRNILFYAALLNTYPTAHGIDTTKYFLDNLSDTKLFEKEEVKVLELFDMVFDKSKLREIEK